MRAIFFAWFIGYASCALGAGEKRFTHLKLQDGQMLWDVVLIAAEPDALRLEHREGACRVKFENLPEAVRKQFPYDARAAEQYSAEQVQRQKSHAVEEAARVAEESKAAARKELVAEVMRHRKAFIRAVQGGRYDYVELSGELSLRSSALRREGHGDLADLLDRDLALLERREAIKEDAQQTKARAELEQEIAGLHSRLREAEARADEAARRYPLYPHTVVVPVVETLPVRPVYTPPVLVPPCGPGHHVVPLRVSQPPAYRPLVRPVGEIIERR